MDTFGIVELNVTVSLHLVSFENLDSHYFATLLTIQIIVYFKLINTQWQVFNHDTNLGLIDVIVLDFILNLDIIVISIGDLIFDDEVFLIDDLVNQLISRRDFGFKKRFIIRLFFVFGFFIFFAISLVLLAILSIFVSFVFPTSTPTPMFFGLIFLPVFFPGLIFPVLPVFSAPGVPGDWLIL